jgi:hypothetical protein
MVKEEMSVIVLSDSGLARRQGRRGFTGLHTWYIQTKRLILAGVSV